MWCLTSTSLAGTTQTLAPIFFPSSQLNNFIGVTIRETQLDPVFALKVNNDVRVCAQVRSLDTQLHPDHLKVITQQVEEEQAILQSQTLLRLQQVHADRQTHSPQVRTPLPPPSL